MPQPRLPASRSQILAFRRHVGALDERLPAGAASLHRAAWAGLQDSMPRAAVLSMHARVAGVDPNGWAHASLVQLWGPRFHNYVVAATDLAVFTLGRLPDDARRRARAYDLAERLHASLDGRRKPFGEAGRAIAVIPNTLRYAATTGRVLLRWDGARQPHIWTVAAPDVDPRSARLELARRYLHCFGPTTAASFAGWAGISPREADATWASLAGELEPVRTPIGDAWMLAGDEAALRRPQASPAPVRLLPSGDAYFLLWGRDRELLVPGVKERTALWTSRVWPGALLVDGDVAGVWRRAGTIVDAHPWRRLSSAQRKAVEAEARALPLPETNGAIVVRWH